MRSILDAICDLIEDGTDIPVVVGSLPPHEGVAIQLATGAVESAYLPRTNLHRDTYVINAKYADQKTAIDNLNAIHEALTKRIGYPEDDEWQISVIATSTSPDYLGQEGNEYYLYGSSIVVKWYDRRMAVDLPQGD